jgi:hypothetical protein
MAEGTGATQESNFAGSDIEALPIESRDIPLQYYHSVMRSFASSDKVQSYSEEAVHPEMRPRVMARKLATFLLETKRYVVLRC